MPEPTASFWRTLKTLISQTTTFQSRMLTARRHLLVYSRITVWLLLAVSDVLLQCSCTPPLRKVTPKTIHDARNCFAARDPATLHSWLLAAVRPPTVKAPSRVCRSPSAPTSFPELVAPLAQPSCSSTRRCRRSGV